MQYRTVGSSSMKVSVVSLGTWVYGGEGWGLPNEREAGEIIRRAIEVGINLIDTAPAYGNGRAEEIVGKAIKGRREGVFIATKCGLQTRGRGLQISLAPSEIRKELEQSLSRMGTDRIDLYQCHWPDPKTPIEETLTEMVRMQDEGKIRFIGVSNFDEVLLERAVEVAPVAAMQGEYSLLSRGIEKEVMPICHRLGLGVLTYGSLGGGILSGKYQSRPVFRKNDPRSFFYRYYREPLWSRSAGLIRVIKEIARERERPPAHVALNWILQHNEVSSALVGARTIQQMEENASTGEWVLSPDESVRLESASEQCLTMVC